MAFPLTVNGFQYVVDVEPETPLLWAIRDAIDLTGTKYGCGIARSKPPSAPRSPPSKGCRSMGRTRCSLRGRSLTYRSAVIVSPG